MGISQAMGPDSLRGGVCTSTTRPASPFEGQMIYETDTDKILVYNGSAWTYTSTPQTLEPGAWTTWTPTITASSGSFTTTTVNVARYTTVNKIVIGVIDVTVTTIGTASGTMGVSLPVTAKTSGFTDGMAIGSWRENTNSGETGVFIWNNTTTMRLCRYDNGAYLNGGDRYGGTFMYEAN